MRSLATSIAAATLIVASLTAAIACDGQVRASASTTVVADNSGSSSIPQPNKPETR